MKILFVCLGNICRSPIAHGLLQHKVEQMGLNWEVDSAGTSDWHEGELPHASAMRVMRDHGIDISYQRSRPIRKSDLAHYDVIYVMDQSNYSDVIRMARTDAEKQKVKLVMEEVHPNSGAEVPDPWGLSYEHYRKVYAMLDEATDKIIERLSSAIHPY
ncbi:MAG: low molecular weight protein-tyrosine-phosphatase [Chitinophagales bacterium]|nr:low molecular weight protein-tyrosine-phosphatase [Chitinophagales bacterium]